MVDAGTLFLDEVGELPPDTQVALLRVLQEREFERVGRVQSLRVNVRVIAATKRDLKPPQPVGPSARTCSMGSNVTPVEVPPRRERKDEILILVECFRSLLRVPGM
jgi:transcriptional regulator with GAF, ATPase, and Fis domain